MFVTKDNIIRLVTDTVHFDLDNSILKEAKFFSILDSFKKFGGVAITEVIDKGSYKLKNTPV